jgi:hypothetical protein
MTSVRDIPTAFTPPGGYGDPAIDRYDRGMPPPVLAGCDDPIVAGAPDLRGTWRAVEVRNNGERVPVDGGGTVSGMWRHTERIEQAGERVVITSGGVIHDFAACDGTVEHGVHDVMAADFSTPIVVAASYEDGVLVLRPQGVPGVEVRRWRDGDHMVWEYSVLATVRLERIEP